MESIREYKIEEILGINDTPLEPNFMNNGKGCNGSYFIDKYNNLIEEVITEIEQRDEEKGALEQRVGNLEVTVAALVPDTGAGVIDGGNF